jgi:HK97 family phage major capsid protein
MRVVELRRQKAELVTKAQEINEKGVLEEEEVLAFEETMQEVEELNRQIGREERLALEGGAVVGTGDPLPAQLQSPVVQVEVPNLNLRTRRGDSEERAIAHYIRTGDAGAVRSELRNESRSEVRASNDTDMNIGTPADGGYTVPVGHYQGIIAKRNEGMLAGVLGVRRVPGVGTTVNVPYDAGSANLFVSTNEAAAFDRDSPVLGQHALTLQKYTKKIQLSDELLQDEDSRLVEFLNDYVGRALALTHNNLLVTEVLANGTSVTLGNATAAQATDVPLVIRNLEGAYAEGAQFLMKRATHYAFLALTGNNWQFVNTPAGSVNSLWGYPVQNSDWVPGVGAGNKSLLFGNFNYVGLREAPGLTFLRDPFSAAGSGQVNLYYYFRAVYKVLLPVAVLYGKHPAS